MMFDVDKEIGSDRIQMRKRVSRSNDLNGFAKRFFSELSEVRSNPTESFFISYRSKGGRFKSVPIRNLDDYFDHLEEYYVSRDDVRLRKLVMFEVFRYLSDYEKDLIDRIYGSDIGIGRGVLGRKEFTDDDIIYIGEFVFTEEDKEYLKKFLNVY